jgi:hypothetical protein
VVVSYLTVTMPRMLKAGKGPVMRVTMFLVVVVAMVLIILKLL